LNVHASVIFPGTTDVQDSKEEETAQKYLSRYFIKIKIHGIVNNLQKTKFIRGSMKSSPFLLARRCAPLSLFSRLFGRYCPPDKISSLAGDMKKERKKAHAGSVIPP
jgi:hypothetical protein